MIFFLKMKGIYAYVKGIHSFGRVHSCAKILPLGPSTTLFRNDQILHLYIWNEIETLNFVAVGSVKNVRVA